MTNLDSSLLDYPYYLLLLAILVQTKKDYRLSQIWKERGLKKKNKRWEEWLKKGLAQEVRIEEFVNSFMFKYICLHLSLCPIKTSKAIMSNDRRQIEISL